MSIALIVILAVILVVMLVRYRAMSNTSAKDEHGGLHNRRIGDGLKRLNANKEKYAVMTKEKLAETPDEDLIEAVLSNLWAKMKPDLSDAASVMAAQTLDRQRMFAAYAITGGIKHEGFEKIKTCGDAAYLPLALDALEAMDMQQSAKIMREALALEEDADALQEPYGEAFHGEGGKERMVAYIREHTDGFLDLV